MDGYGPSTYGDRFADVYDEWYEDAFDTEAAVERVAALAGSGRPDGAAGPVLELGCGSGRLAVPLAARGIETWAIDASAAMVARLRARPGGDRVHAVVGDMAELSLPGAPPFAVVLCAFNTFFNLTSTAAQRRCLARVAERLAPGGRLVLEAFVPHDGADDEPRDAVEVKRLGLDEVVLMVSRVDPATRTIVGQHVQLRDGGVRLRPSVLHYASPEALDALAAEVGLHLVERVSSWRGGAFTSAASSHVSTYALR